MASSMGTVKAVLSGDTIVVVGKAVGQAPPQEITLTLASIQAPRISRGPSQTAEEPYGWECRELLRKYCIGKQVTFRILYFVSMINRTFADVELVGAGETSLAKLVVEAGLATVAPVIGDGKVSSYYDDLVVLEEEAKEAFRGVHSLASGGKGKDQGQEVRKVNWSPTQEQIEEIFNKHKGKPVPVIVEHVRDGSSLRVLVLESMTYLSFALAGILSPRVVKHKDGGNDGEKRGTTSAFNLAASDPYALQARHFIELRLLNREVEVLFQALDRVNVLGTVLHPKGNVAVEVVKVGLARVNDRFLSAVAKDTALALRLAEREAQAKRLFIWEALGDASESGVPGTPIAASSSSSALSALATSASSSLGKGPVRQFEGVVLEVLSGDTISVLEDAAGEGDEREAESERRVTLSSIRAPRIGNTRGDGCEPWAVECKDCLRSRLIGRRVLVIVDYEKSFASTYHPESTDRGKGGAAAATTMRYFATVKALPSGRNVALMLLQEGLVTCSTRSTSLLSPVRSSEDLSAMVGGGAVERNFSCEFDSAGYLIAEAEAAAKGRGLHGPAPPKGTVLTSNHPAVADFSVDNKKAKPFLAQLLNKASINGTLVGAAAGADGRGPGACYFRGTVEFVYSGSRVKVLVPSESCVLSLTLAQIRVPLPARTERKDNNSNKDKDKEHHAASSSSLAARPAEPFADEARAFTRRHVNQRTVEMRLDDVDKNGIGLGRLYLQVPLAPPPGMPTTPGGGPTGAKPAAAGPLFAVKPFAVMLVAEGLARVDRRFQPSQPDAASEREQGELVAAQEAAMAAKKGIWSIPGAVEAETKVAEGAAGAADRDDTTTVADGGDDVGGGGGGGRPPHSGPSLRGDEERCVARVCGIVSGTHFYVHVQAPARIKQLQAIEQALSGLGDDVGTLDAPPKKGQLVLAKKTGEGEAEGVEGGAGSEEEHAQWRRARVEGVDKDVAVAVFFVDHGTRASVASTALAPQPAATKALAAPPQAIECTLAFLAAPDTGEDEEDGELATRAVEFFGDEANGKDMTLQVLGSERGTGKLIVALYDDGGEGAVKEKEKEKEKTPPADTVPSLESPPSEDTQDQNIGTAAASPWGTKFAWGNSSNSGISSSNSSNAGDAEEPSDETLPKPFTARNVSDLSLGDIIAAEEAAAAEAISNSRKVGGNGSSDNLERVVSVNEAILAQGLARLSRSAARFLKRGNGPKKTWTPLGAALHEHLLEAEAEARRAHRNLFRHGDPPESDDDKDTKKK